MPTLLACFLVLCCNIVDPFADFGGVEGVEVSVSGVFLGDLDTLRGRDEWSLQGCLNVPSTRSNKVPSGLVKSLVLKPPASLMVLGLRESPQ
jgi:hypothetical protein